MTPSQLSPFHLAIPVSDLETTRRFYRDVLGCVIGRESPDAWIDFSLFGHQVTVHLRATDTPRDGFGPSLVDGDAVPIPHFGVVLAMDAWQLLAERLEATDGIDWILRPKRRFVGEPGEQATFFLRDPSGNALEFKGFADARSLFAR